MLAVQPVAPQVVLQAAEVGAVACARLERWKAPKHVLAHDALAVLLDHDRRRAVRIDVQGFVAAAHHLFEIRADQPVVLDRVADFPRRESIEVAHGKFSLWLIGFTRIDRSREVASELGIERVP